MPEHTLTYWNLTQPIDEWLIVLLEWPWWIQVVVVADQVLPNWGLKKTLQEHCLTLSVVRRLMDSTQLTIIILIITWYSSGEDCCSCPRIGCRAAGLLRIICFIWVNWGLFTNWERRADPIYPPIWPVSCWGCYALPSGMFPFNKYYTARSELFQAAFSAFITCSRSKPIDINSVICSSFCLSSFFYSFSGLDSTTPFTSYTFSIASLVSPFYYS